MLLSVVIPTYNYSRFLPEAIDSVLAQTLPADEIIVADDGSDDDTATVVARYGRRIRYIRYPHRGVYATRQAVLAEIRGEWFLNLDADNLIGPDFLESSLDVARSAGPKCAFVYPDRVVFGAYSARIRAPDFDIERFKRKNFVDMNSLILVKAARLAGFDPAFNDGWGDYDFFLRLAKSGWTGAPQHASPLHYRVHGASITAATEAALTRKRDLMKRIAAKHGDFFSPSEAAAAIRYFSPAAARRNHVATLVKEGRHLAALGKIAAYNVRLLW